MKSDDLSWRELDRVSVVDSVPAMFPGVTATGRGMLASFATVPDGMPGGQVGVVESVDGGRTWDKPRLVVQLDDSDEAAINQIGLHRLANGELLMPYCRVRIRGGYANRQASLHLARSSDDGVNWKLEGPLVVDFHEPLTYGAVVEPSPGRLLLPVWGRRRPSERWRSSVVHSTDNGRSWEAEPVTVGYDPSARLRTAYARPAANAINDNGEPVFNNVSDPDFRPHADVDGFTETSIAVLPDGRLLAVLRQQGVEGSPWLWLYRSESGDTGRTWSPPSRLALAGTSPALFVTSGGELLLAYRVHAPDGSEIEPGVRLASSPDDGLTWRDVLTFCDPKGYRWNSEYQCGYPDLVELDDSSLVVVFYSYDPSLPHRRYVAASRITTR